QYIEEGAATSFCILAGNNPGVTATVADVEAALDKENVVVPYVKGSTYAILTYPTKLSKCGVVTTTGCEGCTSSCQCQSTYTGCDNTTMGSFFNGTCAPSVNVVFYDLTEHTVETPECGFSPCVPGDTSNSITIDSEVNVKSVGLFDEGWANIQTCSPVVPLIANLDENGFRITTPAYDECE
ncbi:MAG: hypothetical protein GXO44_05155, partial [Deferribacteres bacterium]|nr:hypothetical protein [Deferribacteres bacterium]